MRALRTLVVSALLVGCSSAVGDDDVRLRVLNEGSVALQSVVVVLPQGERITAARLGPGEATPLVRVAEAYRYAYAEAMVGTRRVVLQPIDYVGESLLPAGCHTYALAAAESGDVLRLTLRRDDGCE